MFIINKQYVYFIIKNITIFIFEKINWNTRAEVAGEFIFMVYPITFFNCFEIYIYEFLEIIVRVGFSNMRTIKYCGCYARKHQADLCASISLTCLFIS